MSKTIPENNTSGHNHTIEEIKEFLEGKLVLAPCKLIEQLQDSGFKNKRKELAVRQYDFIKRRSEYYETERNEIYHKCLLLGASQTLANDVKKWLREHNFIYYSNSYSNDPTTPKCISYAANDTGSDQFYRIPGTTKLREQGFTQAEYACEYTREMIGKLTIDTNTLAQEIKSRLDTSPAICVPRWLRANAGRIVELAKNIGVVRRGKLGNRLYSPFVNLKKDHRRHVRFDKQQMCTLDMAAAHPTLLANLAKDSVLLHDCLSDVFYQKMPSFAQGGREAAKEEYFAFAYGPLNANSPAATMMAKHYEKAMSFIAKLKATDYRKFSHFMQQQESRIWIDQIYATIIQSRIPALTIHDAVYVCDIHKEDVKEIIRTMMKKNKIQFLLREDSQESDDQS